MCVEKACCVLRGRKEGRKGGGRKEGGERVCGDAKKWAGMAAALEERAQVIHVINIHRHSICNVQVTTRQVAASHISMP